MDLLAVSLPSSFCNTDTFSALFLPGLLLPSTSYPVLSTDTLTESLWKTFTIPATTYWTHISISSDANVKFLTVVLQSYFWHSWNISMYWHQNLLLSRANTSWADDSTGQTQLALYFPWDAKGFPVWLWAIRWYPFLPFQINPSLEKISNQFLWSG